MQKSNRVLIIGLDGATWNVLNPWIEDGSLPNLSRLRQGGSWGTLYSSIPPITAAAWSTFMTGKRPGRHGVFHFINLFKDEDAPPDDKPELVNARTLKSSTMWDILAHHQRQMVLINIPMTYPPRPVNGTMITGLLTPKNAPVFTYPPELSKEITDYQIDLDRFIDKKPFQDSFGTQTTHPSLSLMEEFRNMMEKRARVSFSLMESKPWDCFMVVFTGTDRMGHYLWPYHRSAQAGDSPEVRQLCQAVHEYYIRLDEIVGDLVEKAGEDVFTVIMSDHGMGPIYTKRAHWNNWLLERGWLTVEANNHKISNPDGWLKRLGIPRDKVGRILRRMPMVSNSKLLKKAAESSVATVDVKQSKAYCVPMYHYVFGIRLNVEEPEKETLREEIIRALEGVTDPETGQRIVQRVYRGEEYYHGPYAENIPEIVVIMDADYIAGYRLSHYSSIATKLQWPADDGDHRMEGVFAIHGPGIISKEEPFPNLNIEDIAPTVLHLMGLPVPSDMDGRVLSETLSPIGLESQPIKYGDPIGFWPEEDKVEFADEEMSDEDEALLRDRLQALGYFE